MKPSPTLYAQTPLGLQARDWLDRHRRMKAWNNAVILNTAAGYGAFIAQYPDSDLTPTARKLEERLRNRPNFVATVATGGALNASAAVRRPARPSRSTPRSQARPAPAPRRSCR